MARKFWERVSGTKILFYKGPLELLRDDADTQISELQAVLALPSNLKALIAGGLAGIAQDEAAFDAHFEDQLQEVADRRDYFHGDNVTVQETIEVVDHRWMSPADMALGAGAIVEVCGEETGNEAINAIDGAGGTNWQHDVDHEHELTFDLGYLKRIDGIRVISSPTPGVALQLSNVQVRVSGSIGGFDKPESHVGVDLAFTDPDNNDRDLTIRNGRYVRITVGSTAHGDNHITVREIELRTRPRTFGL